MKIETPPAPRVFTLSLFAVSGIILFLFYKGNSPILLPSNLCENQQSLNSQIPSQSKKNVPGLQIERMKPKDNVPHIMQDMWDFSPLDFSDFELQRSEVSIGFEAREIFVKQQQEEMKEEMKKMHEFGPHAHDHHWAEFADVFDGWEDENGDVRDPTRGLAVGGDAAAYNGQATANEKLDLTEPKIVSLPSRPPMFAVSTSISSPAEEFKSQASSLAILYRAVADALKNPKEIVQVVVSNAGKGDGVLTLAAAVNGAHYVYCFEPYVSQQRSIWLASRLNDVEDRIHMIPLVLNHDPDQKFMIESETSSVPRNHVAIVPHQLSSNDNNVPKEISSLRLDSVKFRGALGKDEKMISYWHIPKSSHGLELRELMGAEELLKLGRIRHIVLSSVGPPSKWKGVAKMTANDALDIFKKMHSWGYDLQVLEGEDYETLATASSIGSQYGSVHLGTKFIFVPYSDYPYMTPDLERIGSLRLWFTLRDDPSIQLIQAKRGHAHR
ncbi:hypothetical protein HK098_002522 [Nowakowskiella sp. JEL0407]|nr:hypothetical protein HK098_002522 [Nowakowskiella sp. JEL0407]